MGLASSLRSCLGWKAISCGSLLTKCAANQNPRPFCSRAGKATIRSRLLRELARICKLENLALASGFGPSQRQLAVAVAVAQTWRKLVASIQRSLQKLSKLPKTQSEK